MTIIEAEKIIDEYYYWESLSCHCHMGHPPCGKCTDCPSEEEYNEALFVLGE